MGETGRVRPCATTLTLILLLIVAGKFAVAQNNYVIQVYGSQTVAPKTAMVELFSNLTADGTKSLVGARLPPELPLPDQ